MPRKRRSGSEPRCAARNKAAVRARLTAPLAAQEAASEEAKRAKVAENMGIVVRKPLNQQDMIARDFNAELRSRVGTRTLVSPDNLQAAGFYCKETGKTLRDSISYLDHINGKRRACPPSPSPLCRPSPPFAEVKALGMSMRVDRSTLEEVQGKFEAHKRKKEEAAAAAPPSFEQRVAANAEEEERERIAKREKKAAERKAREAEREAAAAEAGEGMDPEMLAMMGFGGGFKGR